MTLALELLQSTKLDDKQSQIVERMLRANREMASTDQQFFTVGKITQMNIKQKS